MAAKFKGNRRGVIELMKSAGVAADLRARAQQVASAAGPGHEVGEGQGRNRARFTVRTVTNEARRRQAKDYTLQRALNSGRG